MNRNYLLFFLFAFCCMLNICAILCSLNETSTQQNLTEPLQTNLREIVNRCSSKLKMLQVLIQVKFGRMIGYDTTFLLALGNGDAETVDSILNLKLYEYENRACRNQDLLRATKKGHSHVMRVLLRHYGSDYTVDREILCSAVEDGFLDGVRALVEHSAQLDDNNLEHRQYTLLGLAVKHNHETVAHYLMKQSTEIDAIDGSGLTALHHALKAGNVCMIKLLLENGATLMDIRSDPVSSV